MVSSTATTRVPMKPGRANWAVVRIATVTGFRTVTTRVPTRRDQHNLGAARTATTMGFQIIKTSAPTSMVHQKTEVAHRVTTTVEATGTMGGKVHRAADRDAAADKKTRRVQGPGPMPAKE